MNPRSNPFSTRWTRPGAIPYRFPAAESLEDCLAQLTTARRLQVVGPHGSGKSTLLRTLTSAWADAGGGSRLIRVGPEGRVEETMDEGARTDAWIFVDGWERLGWTRRTLLRWRAPRLLVTTHRDLGWPALARPQPTPGLAIQIARQLQQDLPPARRIADQVVASCFDRCGGNVRETLFALYDVYEAGEDPAVTLDQVRDGSQPSIARAPRAR